MTVELLPFQVEDIKKLAQENNCLIYYPDTVANFLKHVEPIGTFFDCWLWTGALGGEGNYGTFSWRCNGKRFQVPAHRFSYLLLNKTIEDALHVDHLCRRMLCINPMHLEAVTATVNNQRRQVVLTHCKSGHPFDEENTYNTKDGHRECKECRREATRKWRRENKLPKLTLLPVEGGD